MTWTLDTALWLEASFPLFLGQCYRTCHVNAAPAGGSLSLLSGLSSSGLFYSQEEALEAEELMSAQRAAPNIPTSLALKAQGGRVGGLRWAGEVRSGRFHRYTCPNTTQWAGCHRLPGHHSHGGVWCYILDLTTNLKLMSVLTKFPPLPCSSWLWGSLLRSW